MKKTFLALLLATSVPAFALQYFVVVPVQNKSVSRADIAVTLAGYTLPEGRVGEPYADFNLKNLLTVTGDPGYTGYGVRWELVSGSLPPGLSLGKDGHLTGTPTAKGTASFQVRATYKTKSGQQAYQLVVANLTVGLAAGSPPEAIVGHAYSYNLTPLLTVSGDNAYNGSGVTWGVVSNTLPAGLYLTADGYIGGTPTAAGTGSITARASYKGVNGEQTYQVVSLDIQVALATATLPAGTVSKTYGPYDFKPLLTVNGDPAYAPSGVTFSTSGVVPPGLSLSSDGVLSGTPTTKNTTGNNFQVIASYKTKTGQQAYTIVVNGAVLEVTQVAGGSGHTCAVTSEGGVKCWGGGHLGNGSTGASKVPVDVIGITAATQVMAGNGHTCAVDSGGVKCWGNNAYGQLGDGTTTNQTVPVDVIGLTSGVRQLSTQAGASHVCALTMAGGAHCWGYNNFGQLGDGTKINRSTPVPVTGLTSGVTQLTVGYTHSCAVFDSGGAKCWGNNYNGQLGDGTTTLRLSPVFIGGPMGVAQLSAGYIFTCARYVAGGVRCWGFNSSGQLGDGTTTQRLSPVNVVGLTDAGATQLTTGYSHACAITAVGEAKCWGSNPYGQLGDGTTSNRLTPVSVVGLPDVKQLSAGYYHTCGVTAPGGVKCWGQNTSSALGDGTLTNRLTPTPVTGF